MKFPCEVKYHGVCYPAGAEVPVGKKGEGNTKPSPEKPGKVDNPVEVEEPKGRKYTEDELNLPYMKLKSLASQNGIKVEKSAKAEEIKELLRAL